MKNLEILVEFYPSVLNRQEGNHGPERLQDIRDYMLKDVQLKENTRQFRDLIMKNPKDVERHRFIKVRLFSAIQPAGTFCNTGKIEDFEAFSFTICIDFDHLIGRLQEFLSLLKKDEYVLWVFVSPSGDGLKVFVKHNLTKPDDWPYLYEELKNYFKEKYGIVADNTSDISRNCFLPAIDKDHDYYNPDSKIWAYRGYYEGRLNERKLKESQIDDYTIEKCKLLGKALKDKQLNICEDYDIWFRLGFSLSLLQEDGRQIFHDISSVSKKYSKRQTDDKYDSFLDDIDDERIDIRFFIKLSEHAIALYVLNKEYGLSLEY